jgi:hypothetical protein
MIHSSTPSHSKDMGRKGTMQCHPYYHIHHARSLSPSYIHSIMQITTIITFTTTKINEKKQREEKIKKLKDV